MKLKDMKGQSLSRALFSTSLVFLFGALIISALTPSEKVLGKTIGLIYLHIGFVAGALLLFLIASIGAVLFLKTGKGIYRVFESNALLLGLLSWVVYMVFSMVIAYMSWGNVNWQEPRLVIAFQILFFILFIILLRLMVSDIYASVLTILGGLGTIAIWSRRWNMLHPEAPIRFSDSFKIKAMALTVIFFIIVSLVLLLIARVMEDVRT